MTTPEAFEKNNPRWQAVWDRGIAPGESFDKMVACPALVDLERKGLIPYGRALVPGCGRGYDVTFLARNERDVVGIDIAEKSITAAKDRVANLLQPGETLATDHFQFNQTSFFDLPTSADQRFSFIYDYTFLCALDPSIRNSWAKQMSDLLSPGGVLVTLIFPICDKPDGPPFAMSLDLVRELCECVGLECLQLEMLEPSLCHEGRDGTGMWNASSGIGRWRKKE